jgi:hypothetical protein
MISVIVCSVNPDKCGALKEHIYSYIGTDFEFLSFDNRKAKWGIAKVYNHLAEKAKYDYLCFIHEDVFIGTQGWGQKMVSFVSDDHECGIIGFSGRTDVSHNLNSSWGSIRMERRANVWDNYKGTTYVDRRSNFSTYHYFPDPNGRNYSNVICIDGMFHFVKKHVWQEIRYDEITFSDFHFYDVDFSFAVARKYKNYVFLDMEVFHESTGKISAPYISGILYFWEKWDMELPYSTLHKEWKECRMALYFCKKAKTSIWKMFRQIYKRNSFFFSVGLLFFLIYVKICGQKQVQHK